MNLRRLHVKSKGDYVRLLQQEHSQADCPLDACPLEPSAIERMALERGWQSSGAALYVGETSAPSGDAVPGPTTNAVEVLLVARVTALEHEVNALRKELREVQEQLRHDAPAREKVEDEQREPESALMTDQAREGLQKAALEAEQALNKTLSQG